MSINFPHSRCLRPIFCVWVCLVLSVPVVRAQEGPVIVFPDTQITVMEVIRQVEAQTSYRFAYENKVFDTSSPVTLEERSLPLRRILEAVTADRYSFTVQGNFILISARPIVIRRQPVSRTEDVYRQTRPDEHDYWKERHPQDDGPDFLPDPLPDSIVYIYPEVRQPDSSLFYSVYTDPETFFRIGKFLPRAAVKMNVLYAAAALTPNMAVEFKLNGRSTFEMAGSWNQWKYKGSIEKGNKKLNHYILRPEYRRWFCEPYNGHFLGIHAFFTQYNISGYRVPLLFKKDYRYEGYGVGAGITYGYHFTLNNRWGLELHAGAGVAYLDYKRFDCDYCGTLIDKRSDWYIGPTRAGISLVYMIR